MFPLPAYRPCTNPLGFLRTVAHPHAHIIINDQAFKPTIQEDTVVCRLTHSCLSSALWLCVHKHNARNCHRVPPRQYRAREDGPTRAHLDRYHTLTQHQRAPSCAAHEPSTHHGGIATYIVHRTSSNTRACTRVVRTRLCVWISTQIAQISLRSRHRHHWIVRPGPSVEACPRLLYIAVYTDLR